MSTSSHRCLDGWPVLFFGDSAQSQRILTQIEVQLQSLAVSDRLISRLQMAVDELLTNLCMHAGINEHDGAVLQLWATPATIHFAVDYAGENFDPVRAPARLPGTSVRDAQPGGVGLLLIRELCDGFSHRYVGGHNLLEVIVKH
jgi:anti-sigma regulatory factor (Ser/Thr protein kinase)